MASQVSETLVPCTALCEECVGLPFEVDAYRDGKLPCMCDVCKCAECVSIPDEKEHGDIPCTCQPCKCLKCISIHAHEPVQFDADDRASVQVENLEIIREEQVTPLASNVGSAEILKEKEKNERMHEEMMKPKVRCVCINTLVEDNTEREKERKMLESIMKEREQKLKEEYQKNLEKEKNYMTERFNFILQNEQVRASLMLREAHRERIEKIAALQTQLECKNLAGLMYVMCAERRKSKLEKLQIIEKYTEYVNNLHEVLTEGQSLIVNLSRGYKTAARVNYEWQQKMKSIISEFQNFIYNFTGGTPETNQYFFDLPELLRCEAPIEDNPQEDPIQEEDEIEGEALEEGEPKGTAWYERLNEDDRPFVIFGDMEAFKPPQRRTVLQNVKAAKTAPRKWKEYAFRDTFVKSNCPKADEIKDDYLSRFAAPTKFECQDIEGLQDAMGRRLTTTSIDYRGNMGSILKIMTASGLNQCYAANRAALLGARDSLEIASTTKLRENVKNRRSTSESKFPEKETINVGSRKTSFFEEARYITEDDTSRHEKLMDVRSRELKKQEEEVSDSAVTKLPHTDSLEVIPQHNPDKDSKINYEKVCPSEQCKKRHVDSFMRSLPPYMNASPFMVYEQNFENYEACTPEQLAILKERINEKKKNAKLEAKYEDPLEEWKSTAVEGVGVQTSILSLSKLEDEMPPCTCRDSVLSPATSSACRMFNVEDLIPVKQRIDEIKKECLYDDFIQFDRFKVVGQDSSDSVPTKNESTEKSKDFRTRLEEIKKILKKHPSLCEMFQANTRS